MSHFSINDNVEVLSQKRRGKVISPDGDASFSVMVEFYDNKKIETVHISDVVKIHPLKIGQVVTSYKTLEDGGHPVVIHKQILRTGTPYNCDLGHYNYEYKVETGSGEIVIGEAFEDAFHPIVYREHPFDNSVKIVVPLSKKNEIRWVIHHENQWKLCYESGVPASQCNMPVLKRKFTPLQKVCEINTDRRVLLRGQGLSYTSQILGGWSGGPNLMITLLETGCRKEIDAAKFFKEYVYLDDFTPAGKEIEVKE